MTQFVVDEDALEPYTAGVATEGAAGAHDTMTGHDDGQRVVVIGAAHGARGAGPTQGGGERTVGRRRAVGNSPQRLPHLQLEGCAPRDQWQVEVAQSPAEIGGQLVTGTKTGGVTARPCGGNGRRAFSVDEPDPFDTRRAPGDGEITSGRGDDGVVQSWCNRGNRARPYLSTIILPGGRGRPRGRGRRWPPARGCRRWRARAVYR